MCADIGSSTGGFTDCMLQRGAEKVYAVDSGYNQLDWRLRSDPRVVCMERTNARYLTAEQIPEPLDFFSVDVAFISLRLILPPCAPWCGRGPRRCLPGQAPVRGRSGKGGQKRGGSGPGGPSGGAGALPGPCREAGFSVKDITFSPLPARRATLNTWAGWGPRGGPGLVRRPEGAGGGVPPVPPGEGGTAVRVLLSSNPYRDRGLRVALEARRILNNAGAGDGPLPPLCPQEGGPAGSAPAGEAGQHGGGAEAGGCAALLRRRRDHPPRGPGRHPPRRAHPGGEHGERGLYGGAGAGRAEPAHPAGRRRVSDRGADDALRPGAPGRRCSRRTWP